jgi:glutathione S-transferase
MSAPIVYGPGYSTYVRTVCMALQEKGIAYKLVEVDLLHGANRTPEHLRRHPFGKVPTFEHDGFQLFETSAISRYIDEAFPGPALQPKDVKARARMNQVMSVIDNYVYGALIGQIVMQRLIAPLLGAAPDEALIAQALTAAEQSLTVVQDLLANRPYLAGEQLSLADLYLVPIYDYFARTGEGEAMLPKFAALQTWWTGVGKRESVTSTRPQLG